MPEGRTYLFIDGAYLRKAYEQTLTRYLGVSGSLRFEQIKQDAEAYRAFYYDSVEGDGEAGERSAEAQDVERVIEQVETIPGYHVRTGTITSRGKRRRQKKVDILLAVDMLQHAFNRNMSKAVLVAGDLDFAPVVEEVMRSGVWVKVVYEQSSGAKGLVTLADESWCVNFSVLYGWSDGGFKASHPLPSCGQILSQPYERHAQLVKSGTCGEATISLYHWSDVYGLIRAHPSGAPSQWAHKDPALLQRYFEAHYGCQIEWQR